MSDVFCFINLFVVLVIGPSSIYPTSQHLSLLPPSYLLVHPLSPTCPSHPPIYPTLTHPLHPSTHPPTTHPSTHFTHPPTHPPPHISQRFCWDQETPEDTEECPCQYPRPSSWSWGRDVVGREPRNTVSSGQCVGCAEKHGDHPKLLGEVEQEGPVSEAVWFPPTTCLQQD